MKVIIAGGRDFVPKPCHWMALRTWFNHVDQNPSKIISGCARGADEFGEHYADYWSIPIERHVANWEEYGKAAGPIRNKAMAKAADALVVFPGGRGTANMIEQAKEHGLPILRIDQDGNWDTTDWHGRVRGQVG